MIPILISAVLTGCIYAMVSLGFALSFRVTRIFDISHGAFLIAAGYLNYWMAVETSVPVWLSIPVSMIVIAGAQVFIGSVALPLGRRAGLRSTDFLILSWLLLVVIQNILAIIFRNASIYAGSATSTTWSLFGARATPVQSLAIGASVVLGAGALLMLRHHPTGAMVRCVGDDLRLAACYGMPVRFILAINALIAGLLTSGAGILMSYQERLDPTLGLRFSVIAIVSTLAGSFLGVAGAVAGALLLAFLETIVLYFIDPALRNSAVYAGLFFVLLVQYRRHRLAPEA
ncbi:MAG: branched-chain amino acid ABC transporter permease [Planctomycetota bacterium]